MQCSIKLIHCRDFVAHVPIWLFQGVDHPLRYCMLFLWRQIFNCVSEFVWKPIGSTSGTGAYHDEGGAKLQDEKSKSNPND